jgi:hypothetical protein
MSLNATLESFLLSEGSSDTVSKLLFGFVLLRHVESFAHRRRILDFREVACQTSFCKTAHLLHRHHDHDQTNLSQQKLQQTFDGLYEAQFLQHYSPLLRPEMKTARQFNYRHSE